MATQFQIAQVNIARMRAPLDDPLLAGFVARLEDINALADSSRGFVWRLQTDAGNTTSSHPYDDDRVLFNLSVWANPEDLRDFVYRSAEYLRAHGESAHAFSFANLFPAPDAALEGPVLRFADRCPAI